MDRQEVVSSLGGVSLSQHLTHTFLWMTAGLAVTAIVAFLTLFSGLWITIYSFSMAPLVLLVAQLGVVIFLTGKLAKMQPYFDGDELYHDRNFPGLDRLRHAEDESDVLCLRIGTGNAG